jgi:hypothetical protein
MAQYYVESPIFMNRIGKEIRAVAVLLEPMAAFAILPLRVFRCGNNRSRTEHFALSHQPSAF